METTITMVKMFAAGLLLVVAYAFAMLLFAFVAMFGWGMFLGIPFWFCLPPMLGWAHDVARALVPAKRTLVAASVQVSAVQRGRATNGLASSRLVRGTSAA